MEFRTELKQLLHLITHSLYSNKRVFLRELVSNASDAIHKLRFDSLDSESLLENDKDFKIHLIPDAKRGRLTIRDNGIGMSRAAIIENLGTVARSGTKAFLDKVKEATAANRPDLIGQFGVGFYSAYMVADQLEVYSRQAGDPADAGVRWVSDGQGEFTVEPANRPSRGTEVILHLKEEDKDEFTNAYTLEQIVKQLNKLVEVLKVIDFRDGEYIDRELVLVKVGVDSKSRAEVMQITDIFRAKIVDVQPKSLTIEITGNESKVEKFLVLMQSFGVLDLTRTGKVALPRK
jgi:molecular chaperone HtpG